MGFGVKVVAGFNGAGGRNVVGTVTVRGRLLFVVVELEKWGLV